MTYHIAPVNEGIFPFRPLSKGRVLLHHECREENHSIHKIKKYVEKRPYKYIWRSFYSPRVVYAPTPKNCGDALWYRLWSSKFPTLAEDESCFRDQKHMATYCPTFGIQLQHIASELHHLTEEFGTEDDTILKSANDESHVKFHLRQSAAAMLYGYVGYPVWQALNSVFVGQVLAKFKLEWAKVNKFARNVVDLGTPASLLGTAANTVKHAMSNVTKLGLGWRFIATPNLEELKSAFEFLKVCANDVTMIFFSDDSCLAIKCVDGIFRCNMDISSCDGSCGTSLFVALLRITVGTPLHPVLSKCVDQCQSKLHISNPYFKHLQVLEPTRPLLFSGCVLTTLINNLANILIYSSLVHSHNPEMRVDQCGAWVEKCARAAGFLVKIECPSTNGSLSGYQFLKFSVDSYGLPYLNLGVILRCIGSCDGDLIAPKGKRGYTRKQLADLRDQQIVIGLRHAGETFLLRALRQRFGVNPLNTWLKNDPRSDGLKTGKWVVDQHLGDAMGVSRYVNHDDVLARYGLTQTEVDELTHYILNFGFGDSINCAATRKIFSLDYGYNFPSP
jgi:hypothetical protein